MIYYSSARAVCQKKENFQIKQLSIFFEKTIIDYRMSSKNKLAFGFVPSNFEKNKSIFKNSGAAALLNISKQLSYCR